MPEIDYVLLAKDVRRSGDRTNIVAAGLDTFRFPAATLPVTVQVGLVLRITFSTRDPVGEQHAVSLEFSGPPGVLLKSGKRFATPHPNAGVPEHWRTGLGIIFRLSLPFPVHGDYSLLVMLDDDPRLSRQIDLRAIEPVAGSGDLAPTAD